MIVSSLAENDVCPVQERTSMGLAPGDDHNDKDALINSHALSWEEIAKLLKQVPCFTEFEPHLADLMDFFWLTH